MVSVANNLSKYQIKILQQFADGASAREIAENEKTSPSSIESVRTQIFCNLGATNMTHAVAIAFREGVLK